MTLRAGTRGRAILAVLAGPAADDGKAATEILAALGQPTGAQAQNRCNKILWSELDSGFLCRRREDRRDRLGRRRQVWVWTITGKGRAALERARNPPPRPPRRRPGTTKAYWWEKPAANRHQAGETITALARDYKVKPGTVKRALARQGVPVTPYARPLPPWADSAVSRYQADDGATVTGLAKEHNTTCHRVSRVLTDAGLRIRRGAPKTRHPPPAGGSPGPPTRLTHREAGQPEHAEKHPQTAAAGGCRHGDAHDAVPGLATRHGYAPAAVP